MKLLDGKKALITGGSSGIGTATVEVFAREGADVAFTYRKNKEGADALLARLKEGGHKGVAIRADVADFAKSQSVVDEAREALGGLDILVNNAGANWDKVIWKMDEEMWDTVIATDLKGVFNYIRAVAPQFKAQDKKEELSLAQSSMSRCSKASPRVKCASASVGLS